MMLMAGWNALQTVADVDFCGVVRDDGMNNERKVVEILCQNCQDSFAICGTLLVYVVQNDNHRRGDKLQFRREARERVPGTAE
jgi:hypothetical protein